MQLLQGDLLVNEGHGSGARGHKSWPSMCMRASSWLPLLRPSNAERAFDCVRANNVRRSEATERSPLGPLRCERWQAAGSKPIELKEHLSDVFDRSVCSAIRCILLKRPKCFVDGKIFLNAIWTVIKQVKTNISSQINLLTLAFFFFHSPGRVRETHWNC